MLMAIVFAYMLYSASAEIGPAAASSDEVETLGERIMEVVADSGREPAVAEVLAELSAGYKQFGKHYATSGKALAKQYKDHSATAAEAFIIMDELNEDWMAGQARATELHFQLKGLLTEDEWNALYFPGGKQE